MPEGLGAFAPLLRPAPALIAALRVFLEPLKLLYTKPGRLHNRPQEAWSPCWLAGLAWLAWLAGLLDWMMLGISHTRRSERSAD